MLPFSTELEQGLRDRRLIVVLLAALALRLAFVLGYPQAPIGGDAGEYQEEARTLAFGVGQEGVPVPIAKGPAYPWMLAAIYRAGGTDAAVRIVQALLGVASVGLTYWLGRAVFGATAGLMAGLLAALHPGLIAYTGLLLTETMTITVLLGFIAAVLRVMRGSSWRVVAAAGLLGGLLVLLREEFLLVALAVAAGAWRWGGLGLRRVGWLLGVAALIILPWMVRNCAVYGAPVLVSPQAGYQLWVSVHPDGWLEEHHHDPVYRSLTDGFAPSEENRRLMLASVAHVARDPLAYARLCLRRFGQFWLGGHSHAVAGLERRVGWYVETGNYGSAAVKLGMLGFNLMVIGLGGWGVWLAWRARMVEPGVLAILGLPIAVKAVMHLLLAATLRHQLPLLPLVMVFAGFALRHLRMSATEEARVALN